MGVPPPLSSSRPPSCVPRQSSARLQYFYLPVSSSVPRLDFALLVVFHVCLQAITSRACILLSPSLKSFSLAMSAIWMTGPAVPVFHSQQRGLSGPRMLVPIAGCNKSRTALFGSMVGLRYPQTTIDSWFLLSLPQSGVLLLAYLPVPRWNSSFLFMPALFSHPKGEFSGKWFSIVILSNLCGRFALLSVTFWIWFNVCLLA